MNISIAPEVQNLCPDLELHCLQFKVEVKSDYPELLDLIKKAEEEISANIRVEDIREKPAIAAARKAYKAIGKDPARYRLSAEALLRRTIQGKGLYKINNVVDLLNLISIRSGISIGGYDVDKTEADIELGIGTASEEYQAIGRGALNIEFMPVLRDAQGAFGSPTSDSTRTMVSDSTKHFLMVFFCFNGKNASYIQEAVEATIYFMAKYANGHLLKMERIS